MKILNFERNKMIEEHLPTYTYTPIPIPIQMDKWISEIFRYVHFLLRLSILRRLSPISAGGCDLICLDNIVSTVLADRSRSHRSNGLQPASSTRLLDEAAGQSETSTGVT